MDMNVTEFFISNPRRWTSLASVSLNPVRSDGAAGEKEKWRMEIKKRRTGFEAFLGHDAEETSGDHGSEMAACVPLLGYRLVTHSTD